MQIFNFFNILPLLLTDASPEKAGGSTGFWGAIPGFLGGFLEMLFNLTKAIGIPSYAVALLLFTIVVKGLLFPLTLKQMRSTRAMQKLQPLMKEINEKYKDDQQKKTEATMKLYKDYNINYLAGCLPTLIQLPILFALFYTVRNFEPASALGHGFLWLKDIFINQDTGELMTPPIWLAALVSVTQFGQQFLTITNRKDQTQKILLYVMPVFIGLVAYGGIPLFPALPATLAVYWIFQSIIGAGLQLFINSQGKKEDAALEERIRLETEKASKKKEKEETQKKSKKWCPPGSPEAEEETRREEAEMKKEKKKEQSGQKSGSSNGKKYKIVKKR